MNVPDPAGKSVTLTWEPYSMDPVIFIFDFEEASRHCRPSHEAFEGNVGQGLSVAVMKGA